MQAITAILGHRVRCRWCGDPVRLVLIPALGDRWHTYVDFERTPENGIIEQHMCSKYPGHDIEQQ